MSLAGALLAPLALLLPAASAPQVTQETAAMVEAAAPAERLTPQNEVVFPAFDRADGVLFEMVANSFRTGEQNQVRIEQRVTIRVAPRPAPVQPNMLADLPGQGIGPHFVERRIGRCLPVSGIVGVQANGGNRLLLFMRDRRIVSAALERACSSRDFYSGFYVERSSDGQLCVDRDTLLSRSGANCRLTRIRQLVESAE